MQEKETKKIASVSEVLRVYIGHAVRYPWLLVFLIVGTVGIQIFDLISPLYLRQFFNILASGAPSVVAAGQLLHIIAFVALFSALSWASRRLQVWCNMSLDAKVMRDLTSSAFEYLIRHSYSFFTSNFAGALTHKVNSFVRSFETIIDVSTLTFLPTVVYVTGAVVVLYVRNHTLGAALALWSLVFLAVQIYMARKRQPVRRARAEVETKLTGTLADAISNQTTIFLFSASTHEDKAVRTVAKEWLKQTLRSWRFDDMVWGILGLLMISINMGLLYGAMIFWQQGLLTVGDFVLIQTYLIGTFNSLLNVNRELRRLYDAFANGGEMVEILNTPHEIKDAPGAGPLAVTRGEIDFKNVTFNFYDRPVLQNFNLTINPHQKMAFVGSSGAGKSTVTKLLLRFFDIKSGSIEIDGQNIASVKQDSLRDAIAFVPQEPILFHRTLMENIRYGRREATDEEVIQAAKKAHCHEFISQLPLKYETFVGERGIKLSGGERQRVAIARAILKNAPVLVLDEATSSLDSESEAFIQDALEVLMQNKTVIVIAHRLSTIMKMDRIVVLEGGTIVAQGTHQELLTQGGLYQKLWSIQAGGFLLDEDAPTESEKTEDGDELAEEPNGK
jgi:ATP-binding cassette subfamily B protein